MKMQQAMRNVGAAADQRLQKRFGGEENLSSDLGRSTVLSLDFGEVA